MLDLILISLEHETTARYYPARVRLHPDDCITMPANAKIQLLPKTVESQAVACLLVYRFNHHVWPTFRGEKSTDNSDFVDNRAN